MTCYHGKRTWGAPWPSVYPNGSHVVATKLEHSNNHVVVEQDYFPAICRMNGEQRKKTGKPRAPKSRARMLSDAKASSAVRSRAPCS
jgi:hypothetical protein